MYPFIVLPTRVKCEHASECAELLMKYKLMTKDALQFNVAQLLLLIHLVTL